MFFFLINTLRWPRDFDESDYCCEETGNYLGSR